MTRRDVVVGGAGLLSSCGSDMALRRTVEAAGTPVIQRLDEALDAIVAPDAMIEKIASGFQFTEGPLYRPEGDLLFSDVPGNVIYRWTTDGRVEPFRKPGGYHGEQPRKGFVGSNGLTLDREGRLIICEHGNRRVCRRESDGTFHVVADRYVGKRLNSPNDAVVRSDGSIYFTDPPYGFPEQDESPDKELSFSGVFRVSADGTVTLLHAAMTRPNGLAFSPDEKYLYVANSDEKRKLWMRFPVSADGSLGYGEKFLDAASHKEPGLPDGMKVDTAGNLFCTGPGGIWVISAAGRHLGTIRFPEIPANCQWGDNGSTLYVTAQTSVYRIRLKASGKFPGRRA